MKRGKYFFMIQRSYYIYCQDFNFAQKPLLINTGFVMESWAAYKTFPKSPLPSPFENHPQLADRTPDPGLHST